MEYTSANAAVIPYTNNPINRFHIYKKKLKKQCNYTNLIHLCIFIKNMFRIENSGNITLKVYHDNIQGG